MSLSDELFRSYLDLRWHFDPAAASLAGVTSEDARLGQYDPGQVREHLAAFRAIEAGIEELAVQDAADEIDRTALLDDVRVTVFRLQHEQPHLRNPAFWLLHLAEALHSLLPAGGRDLTPAGAALARLQSIPAFLESAEATLRRPARLFVDGGAALCGPVGDLIQRVRTASLQQHDADAPALAEAATAAESALASFRAALDGDLSEQAEDGAGVGEDHFERLLHHQHAVSAGAPELWRFLLRLEEETETALRRLAREAAGTDDWRSVMEHRVAETGPSADIGSAAVRELADIGEFLERHELVSVDLDGLEVAPLPSWLVPVTCHAAYVPAPLAGSGRAHLYLSGTPFTSASLPALLAEFGLPGLHLQMLHAERQRSEIRRHLASTLLREEWGVYALELLDEAGYWPEPADRLVVRAHVLLRVRLAQVDLGIHTRQMTVGEAVESLTDRFPITPAQAIAAVRGIALDPSAATGAMIGRRELGRLREARAGRDRPFFSLRPFHDEVLSYGGLPIPLIRWGMGVE